MQISAWRKERIDKRWLASIAGDGCLVSVERSGRYIRLAMEHRNRFCNFGSVFC